MASCVLFIFLSPFFYIVSSIFPFYSTLLFAYVHSRISRVQSMCPSQQMWSYMSLPNLCMEFAVLLACYPDTSMCCMFNTARKDTSRNDICPSFRNPLSPISKWFREHAVSRRHHTRVRFAA
ncbi:hypothetical protein QBC38DRAFT_477566 [Podospora fimiseda]|uniref:Uncharacterized protein n=1 Tax=Podospora fimiseda TaxID=252190 RepID=A0AAN7H2T4_9PEZI|nr:hypothetical protein QBC38DRAFT_477566 [Podospora fimiseda]